MNPWVAPLKRPSVTRATLSDKPLRLELSTTLVVRDSTAPR